MHLHHLMHLTPNAILTLALLAHACEAFVGMGPSMALFCQFFRLVRSLSLSPGAGVALQNCTIGRVFFQWRGNDFFPLAQKGKWENWERRW